AEDEGPATTPAAEVLPDMPEWSDGDKLKYEKEALDFYFSSHPLAAVEEDLRRFSTHSVNQISELPAGQEVTLGVMLTQLKYRTTEKARNGNSRFLLCVLEDFTGQAKGVMWGDELARHKDEVQEDRVCFVRGTIDRRRGDPEVIISRLLSIEQAQRELTKGLVLLLRLGMHEPEVIDAIGRVLKRAPGKCDVFLSVRDGAGKRTMLRLPEGYRINPATVATGELETILGQGCV